MVIVQKWLSPEGVTACFCPSRELILLVISQSSIFQVALGMANNNSGLESGEFQSQTPD